MSDDLTEKFKTIQTEAGKFHRMFAKRHGINYWWNAILVGLGIAMASGIAFSGLAGKPEMAAALGVISTAIFAIHGAYALGEKSEFQRIVALEAAILLEDITLGEQTSQQLSEYKKRLDALRRHADSSLPRGGGMEAVRRMYDELRKSSDAH